MKWSDSENLTVHFTEHRVLLPPFLASISEALKDLGHNAPLELGKLLPSDRQRRYEWLHALKGGLEVSLIHLTYASGSNVAWKSLLDVACTATTIDDTLCTAQPIIEQMKKGHPILEL